MERFYLLAVVAASFGGVVALTMLVRAFSH